MVKSKSLKRAFKFFADCKDPTVSTTIHARSTDKLMKTICKAALNVERVDIPLKKNKNVPFKEHHRRIARLTTKKFTIPQMQIFYAKERRLPHPPDPAINCAVSTRLGTIQQMR